MRKIIILSLISTLTIPFVSAFASTYVVNSTIDEVDATPGNDICATASGQCTLRAAVQEANAHAGADSITLPIGTFRLTKSGALEDLSVTGDLDVTDELSITGAGMSSSVIDGLGADRIIQLIGNFPFAISAVGFKNGNAGGDPGGAVYSLSTGAVSISSAHFDTCGATAGGAVFHGAALSVSDSIFENCNALSVGGALYRNGDSPFTVTNSDFFGNTAAIGGGAILNSSAVTTSDLTVTGCDFDQNVSPTGLGAAIYASGNGKLTVADSSITNSLATNAAIVFGGDSDLISITNSTISSNTGLGGAGGIIVALNDNPGFAFSGTIVVDGLTMDGNVGLAISAAAYLITYGDISVTSATITNNFASNGIGAGLYALAGGPLSDLSLTDSTLDGNVATLGGAGALVSATQSMTLSRVRARRNSVLNPAGLGGGLYLISGTSASLSDVEVSENSTTAGSSGGGMLISSGTTLSITNGLIFGNSAGAIGGGALLTAAGQLSIENSTISSNYAGGFGGGLHMTSPSASIKNSTFTQNTSSTGGSSLYNMAVALTLSNSIISEAGAFSNCAGNAIVSGGNNFDDDSSCVPAAGSDQSINPQLDLISDNGGFSMTHALLSGSPAIDRFTTDCPATDQRAVTRPFDGDQNGSAQCDSGAFEFNDACPTDPDKQLPGVCGCGVPDTDDNGNTTLDCLSEEDLEAQAVALKKLVGKLKPVSSQKEKDKRTAVKDSLTALVGFSTLWSSNISLSDGSDLPSVIKKVKKAVNKARKAKPVDPEFAAKKKAAKSQLNKLAKLLG